MRQFILKPCGTVPRLIAAVTTGAVLFSGSIWGAVNINSPTTWGPGVVEVDGRVAAGEEDLDRDRGGEPDAQGQSPRMKRK